MGQNLAGHIDRPYLPVVNFRPGNWQWEILFDNIADAKVILTVRGSDLMQ